MGIAGIDSESFSVILNPFFCVKVAEILARVKNKDYN